MSVQAAAGPVVRETEIEFSYRDPDRLVVAVALAHELGRPRRIPFARTGRGRWELRLPRPDAWRLEYLLELTRRGGATELVPDPANPLRAPGPFGAKSVVELPGYAPPEWVEDDESPPGELTPLELRTRRVGRVRGLLWSAHDTDPREPLPLLVVHDGPEYAQYSELLRLLDHLVAFGELPPFRAALAQPPRIRNETYSAAVVYARAFALEILPGLRKAAPTARPAAGLGASLGALSLLHVHWMHPALLGGLFLQSGSYFRRRSDRQESGFPRFERISRFVGRVLQVAERGGPPRVPVTLTCGSVEENLDNNRAVAAALTDDGWPLEYVEHPDAHNWISWRDSLNPHLAELLLRAWT
jgi:enterochelin esterase family protein